MRPSPTPHLLKCKMLDLPTIDELVNRAIANDYIAALADGSSPTAMADLAANAAAAEWESIAGQTVEPERIAEVARELAKHAAEVQRAHVGQHRAGAGAFAKVCKTCGRTSAQVSFAKLSVSACTPCDAERKRSRNSRIAARGMRVVSAAPPARLPTLNPKHLIWIRTLPCTVEQLFCDGPVQAHHVRTANNSGTSVLPPDTCTVPLCVAHHAELHHRGVQTFDAEHGVNLREVAKELARQSPHTEKTIAA